MFFCAATANESSEESEQSDNEEDLETLDKDVLNESFGLKSLLEEDSNKQSQVSHTFPTPIQMNRNVARQSLFLIVQNVSEEVR